LYGVRSREKALEIMKDSRIGVMGAVALFLCLSAKWAGISTLSSDRLLLLFIIPAYARSAMIFGFFFLPYGRPEGGTGHALSREETTTKNFVFLIIPILLSFFAGWRGICLNIAFFAIVFILLFYYKRRMGCITGDMLGAMNEIMEAALFLAVSINIY